MTMTEGPLLKHMRAQNDALREEIVREIANLPQADLRGVLRMIEVWKGAHMTDALVKRLRAHRYTERKNSRIRTDDGRRKKIRFNRKIIAIRIKK